MKKSLIALFAAAVAFAGLSLAPADAEAKRLGGGGSFGMQRSTPAPAKQAVPPKPATPAQATNPAAATAPAAAQAGKRSWVGPIAGLAAGLGIAALLSHLGLGEEFASFLMIALLVFAAIFIVRLLFRKRTPQAAMQYAGAADRTGRVEPLRFEAAGVGAGGTAPDAGNGPVPADFDVEGFLRQAKLNFLRLQAANDRGAMDDVKSFTTPEVFAEIQMQFEERGRAAQQTDVAQLDADLLEVVSEGSQHVASVRFHGLLSEESGAPHVAFDEIWHLSKPIDGSRGWLIAGIQQNA